MFFITYLPQLHPTKKLSTFLYSLILKSPHHITKIYLTICWAKLSYILLINILLPLIIISLFCNTTVKAPHKGAQGRMFQAGEKVEARAQRHQGQECG